MAMAPVLWKSIFGVARIARNGPSGFSLGTEVHRWVNASMIITVVLRSQSRHYGGAFLLRGTIRVPFFVTVCDVISMTKAPGKA
jgi:hypothetical protein